MVNLFTLLFLIIVQTNGFAMLRPSSNLGELDSTSNQVIIDFAKKMQKNGLRACGFGGREENGKLMDFDVSFKYDSILNISTARCLIVESVLLFLEEINNDEEVRKYLYHYPFTAADVIVSILPDCSILSDKDCCSSIIVKAYLGRVSYCLDDGLVMPFLRVHEESFEEALKKLEECR